MNRRDDTEDDFPTTLGERALSPNDVFNSFVECQRILKSVPKASQDSNYFESLYRAVKENLRYNQAAPALYRKKTDAEAMTAKYWLSRVRESAWFYLAWNELPAFQPIEADFLQNLASLSAVPQNILGLTETLSNSGIILVHERAIPGMKVDGACFLLESGHPVIALSLRYARLDTYWFTLLHELAHIVLHRDTLTTPIVDDIDDQDFDLVEAQANKLAADSLIRRSDWRSAKVKYDMKEESLLEFAAEVNVHPAIVAGRLQRELNRYELFSKITNSENTRKIIFGDE